MAAWVWHVVELFREVDPGELPARARSWVGGLEADECNRMSVYSRLEHLNANL